VTHQASGLWIHLAHTQNPCQQAQPPLLHTWILIMSFLLLSGMSMGVSTVLRPSGSAWNWLRVVALPSCTGLELATLKLDTRLEMNVVLPRPLSPADGGGGGWGGVAAVLCWCLQ
jgi:hypothetical protein